MIGVKDMSLVPMNNRYTRQYPGFRVQMADADAELELYGEIVETQPVDWWTDEPLDGNWIVQSEVLDELKKLKSAGARKLTLRVNSIGGDAGVAITIHNRLREMQRDGLEVTCVVDGVAMSGGSLIMCACDTVRINPASLVMIHKCWSYFWGGFNADELRQMADSCDAYDRAQASIYSRKTGLSQTKVLHMMGETTYMTGEDAVEQGFADELLTDAQPVSMAASAAAGTVTVNGRTMRVEKRTARKLEETLAGAAQPQSEVGSGKSEVNSAQPTGAPGGSSVAAGGRDCNTAGVCRVTDTAEVCRVTGTAEDGDGAEIFNSELRIPNSELEKVSTGEGPEDINNDVPAETGEEGGKTMARNLEELRAENPELAAQVEADVRAGLTADTNAAVEAERSRIREIDEIAGLYPTATVTEAKYGAPCTAQEMAFRAAQQAAKTGSTLMTAVMADANGEGGANAVKAADAAPDNTVAKTDAQKQAEADKAVHALFHKNEEV